MSSPCDEHAGRWVSLGTGILSGVLKGMGVPCVVSAGIHTSCENLEGTGAFCVEKA